MPRQALRRQILSNDPWKVNKEPCRNLRVLPPNPKGLAKKVQVSGLASRARPSWQFPILLKEMLLCRAKQATSSHRQIKLPKVRRRATRQQTPKALLYHQS